MKLDAVKNFAAAELSQGYDELATVIELKSGMGSRFPDPAIEGEYNLVWWNYIDFSQVPDDPNVEIVRCTAKSGDQLTVIRAQEGTSATVKNLPGKNYRIQLGVTAKTITDIQHELDSKLNTSEKYNGYNNELLIYTFLGT